MPTRKAKRKGILAVAELAEVRAKVRAHRIEVEQKQSTIRGHHELGANQHGLRPWNDTAEEEAARRFRD
jgi:hypothetical protein